MNSRTTERFRRCFANLPAKIQRQAREAYQRFLEDPSHPGLRFKPVHPIQPIYSVRISLDYRALGVRESNAMVWFWIGKHADYERILAEL